MCAPTGLTATLGPRLEARTPSSDTFTIDIYQTGGTTALLSFTGTGSTIALPANTLTTGTYDIRITTEGYLRSRSTHTLSNTAVTLPTLKAGNLNSDNIINTLDWSYMNTRFFTNDPIADINQDGTVNSIDFSYMVKNWGDTGD